MSDYAPCGQPYNLTLTALLEAKRAGPNASSISLDDATIPLRVEVVSRACTP